MKRGEVWWANLDAPAGRRPVVLLSRDEAYLLREFVTIAPISTRIRGIRSEVPLGPEDGLSRPSVANLDSITTIPKITLERKVAALSPEKLDTISAAIHFALGLE